MVPEAGFEPAWVAPHGPQPCVSASSTTPAAAGKPRFYWGGLDPVNEGGVPGSPHYKRSRRSPPGMQDGQAVAPPQEDPLPAVQP